MMIQSETMVSIADASRDFLRVARLVDEKGSAVILKNNAPRYLVIAVQRNIRKHLTKNCLRLVNSLLKKTGLRMRRSPND